MSSYQTKKVIDNTEQQIEEELGSFDSEGLKEFIDAHKEIINKLLVERPGGFSANQVQSRLNHFEWKDESWKDKTLNQLVSQVTEKNYSKWGRWFTDICDSNILPHIVYHKKKKGNRKRGLGTIHPRSKGEEVDGAIQIIHEKNRLKKERLAEKNIVSWFHRAKKSSNEIWKGYPNQPLASKYLSLLISAPPEKIWEFDESIDINYYLANLSTNNYVVSEHKYVCPECNILLKNGLMQEDTKKYLVIVFSEGCDGEE